MLRVLLLGMKPGSAASLRRASGPDLEFDQAGEQLEDLERLTTGEPPVDALVVGPRAAEPVRFAQRAHALDRDLGVLLLADPEGHAQLASAVRTAPFLGSAVRCMIGGDPEALAAAVEEVALQTSRRRSHRPVAARTRARMSTLTFRQRPPPIEDVVALEELLDYAPIAVLALDLEGVVLASNRFARRLLGRSEGALVGARLAVFFSPADGRRLEQLVARGAAGGERPPAEILTLAESERDAHTVEVTATSIAERLGRPGIMIVMQDVTDRESARTIRLLNAELERRIAELDAANRELDAFAYSVSHDLRAPLRAIDGFSSALLSDYGDRLDAAGQHALQRVRAGAQRMSALIDDLLTLSRISRAPLRLERVDLGEVARAVVAELARREPGRQVAIEIGAELHAMGDGRLMTIALENLLGNAWKFTSRRPDARVAFGRTSADERAFFVRDNGAGFDMRYADRLFTPFQRLHGASEFEGTGIGLATVNRIIARHGGRIWAEAKEGAGATFYFTLGNGP